MVRKRKFARDESGAVAPLVGLSLFALIAAAGIAFDYARIASLDTEMQNAADQAALAAASQLDKGTGAVTRADAAAKSLLSNLTLLGNDSGARKIDIVETVFYKTKAQAVSDNPTNNQACPATDIGGADVPDNVAGYVCVRTTARTANFALTPVVAAMSGQASAMAVATIQRATCKTPPLMICNPKPNPAPGDKLSDTVAVGTGIRVTGHGNTKACTGNAGKTLPDGTVCEQNVSAWAPGDFGFLEVGDGSNAALIKALAHQTLDYDCTTDDGQDVNTGNPQALYAAVNTRFGIADFPENGNHTLMGCNGVNGSCPAAMNSVHDLANDKLGQNGMKCNLGNPNNTQGWYSPTNRFSPKAASLLDFSGNPPVTHDGTTPSTLGYSRDLCHYNSFNQSCGGTYPNKIGNGNWARGDYFAKYHPSITPPSNLTRYKTYRWELGDAVAGLPGVAGVNRIPTAFANNRTCLPQAVAAGIDRRVLTVAIVNNCSALSGSSTQAIIGEYVDMFLVEPIYDDGQGRGNGDIKDSIYMEFIGPSPTGATGFQTVVKEVPLIVK